MSRRLYLSREECVKLKKLFDGICMVLEKKSESRLDLQIAILGLNEIAHHLSPVSRTKRLLESLRSFMETLLPDSRSIRQAIQIIDELRTIYKLDEGNLMDENYCADAGGSGSVHEELRSVSDISPLAEELPDGG